MGNMFFLALGFGIWLVLTTVLQLYHAFHAPRCPPEASASACYTSLFGDGESVDIYVFLTSKAKLQWWTSKGLRQLQKIPLWNATSVAYGQAIANKSAPLPLSVPALQGVRRNESLLFAHCFVARAGKDLSKALGVADYDANADRLRSWDLIHASGPLIRLLPQRAPPKRNLLSTNDTDEGENSSSGVKFIRAKLPVLGREVNVYPHEALCWAAAVFCVGAFFEPSALVAVPRQLVAAVLVPWLWQQRAKMLARQQVEQRELDQEWWQLQREAPITPHLVPKIKLSIAADTASYDARRPPPLLYKEMLFKDGIPIERDIRYDTIALSTPAGQQKRYIPHVSVDIFGMRQREWRPLDRNVSKEDPQMPMEVEIQGPWHYTLMQMIKGTLNMYMRVGFSERDLDDIRDWIFRHPLHVLIFMQVIGFLQTILTTLAFKNDISFFKGRSDYTGLSSRSLATDTLQEIIVFLYLFDYEDISRLVLFQIGASAAISAWKYGRVARLSLNWSYMLPWIRPTRGEEQDSKEKSTEEIDAKGMEYVKWALYPLSACWGLYNLYYYNYKSWWSWLISSLADFAYTFGFINMMPQIFINYKLKSVAHMPWRVLMYKFFNTFIDDVFAFFVMSDYMTKKHRYMTLRDDIVFFIFMYQRYCYKVDPTRADEFGYVYAEAAELHQPEQKELGSSDDGVELSAPAAAGEESCGGAGAETAAEEPDAKGTKAATDESGAEPDVEPDAAQ